MSSSTDPLGITVTYTYEPVFGNVITEKFSNIATQTENTYDAWGRLISKSLPDGNTMTTAINWSSVMGAKKPLYYTSTTNSANSLWSNTYYDELGRTLKDETIGFADISKYSTTSYNSKGQTVNQTTYLGADKTTQATYTYWDDGRVNTVTNKITNAVVATKYTYGTNSVETTADLKKYTKLFDNWGNLKQSDEPTPGGSIYYKYFSHGKPSSIQSPASTIEMLYDELGQQTSLADPDAGTTTYRYDAFNRLTYQKRATGEETKQVYDPFGRLEKVTDGLGTMTYQYEYFTTLGAEFGKMEKATEAKGTYDSYTYDELGRVKTTTKYIDATNVYTYTNVYDQGGKISQVTYPGGNIVNNQYDKYGILNKVLFTSFDGTNTNTPVWTLNTSNATTLAYGLGNGLTTTKSYDASKGYSLSSIVTANGTNLVQSCYYDFNAINGNLNSREDRRTGYALKETFGYDGLDRLTNWAVAKNGINTFSNSLAYNPDKSGNIDSKSDIGIYGFDPTGKPHQLNTLQLTQTSYYPGVPHNISYTSFGKVNRLDDRDNTVLFTYGPDQQRCKSVMQGRGATQYTMYYGGAYEKKVMADGTTTQYTYIPAGDGLAAVFMKTGTAAGSLYYIHKDHLGSITALTNTAGNIVEQYAYDPWGRRRNPSDWSFNNVPVPSLIHRGFTGHEHIDELTLINMNGRIYDPVLGMFISPDPYLQSPTQSQNFNRFSYAMGNPLKFTDPDGNFFFIIAIGYALMQADIAGNASKNHGGDYWSGFGKSAGVSAAGMLVGAGVGSVVGGLFSTATSALGSTLSGAASGALSGGITGGVMNAFMGGSFKSGFINGAIGGGLMGALGGYMKYAESNAIQEVLGEGKVDGDLTTYKTMGKNYDNSYAVEANDMTLCEDYRNEINVFEGRGGLNRVTTMAGNYGMTTDGDFVNMRNGDIVNGYWDPKNGVIHVSSNLSAAKDLTGFRAVAGHEYIHSYHDFYGHHDKFQKERVAYKYSYDVYNKAGMTNIATAIKNMAITKGFWGESLYSLPPSFKSFTFY